MSIKGDSRTATLAGAECPRVCRGKIRRLASLAGCPGLSGCTGPRRARPPLLQSTSRPDCAAPAQNWGRMAHADGLVSAQVAHGASLAGRGCGRPRTARAAQATACGKRRAHCATPLACHARQAGRGRCCCRAWAARRARVAWERARQGQAPAVRRGATQGTIWASGWPGHSRLSTFARQDVSAALLVATCGRAWRRPFAHPPATSRMCRDLAVVGW